MSERFEIRFTEGGVGLIETVVTLGMAPIIEKTLDAVSGDENHGWYCTIRDKITGLEQTDWGTTKEEAQKKTFATLTVAIEEFQADQIRQRQEEEMRQRIEAQERKEAYLRLKRNSKSEYSSSSDESDWMWIVYLIVIGAVIVVIWLAVNVVLPVLLLNSALIFTIAASNKKPNSTTFALLAFLGAAYMLLDTSNGWLSSKFVHNVVKDPTWINLFVYVNSAALGISAWLLVKPLWTKARLAIADNKRKSMLSMVAAILLVVFATASAPILFHTVPNSFTTQRISFGPGNQGRKQAKKSSKVTIPAPSNSSEKEARNIRENIFQPIDGLFSAWGELNFEKYMQQWSKNGVQKSKKYPPRTYAEIYENRKSFFQKLLKIDVVDYKVLSSEVLNNEARLLVQYSMVFHLKSGKTISDTNVKERYILVFDEGMGKWLIKENIDYLEDGNDAASSQNRTIPENNSNNISTTEIIQTASSSSYLKSSSYNTYFAQNAIDGNPSTPWVEGQKGYGYGEWLKISFSRAMSVNGIRIMNGYNYSTSDKVGDRYHKNSRIKRLSLAFSGGNTLSIDLNDTREFQTFNFQPTLTESVTLIIEDVYKGTEWDDTCLSEIEFLFQ